MNWQEDNIRSWILNPDTFKVFPMIFHCWYNMRSIRKNARTLCWLGMAHRTQSWTGIRVTIPPLIVIWFSHYKRLIASTLSNQCEITKEISQNKDHLSQSFSSKPQKNIKSEMESLKWELLKKSYPWRQESRVNHNGTAGHSIPRYYITYERSVASLPKYWKGRKS